MRLEDTCDKEGRRVKSITKKNSGEYLYGCQFNGSCDWKYNNINCVTKCYSATEGWGSLKLPVCSYKLRHEK